MTKRRTLHISHPLRWNLQIYDDAHEPLYITKLRAGFLWAALAIMILGVFVVVATGEFYAFRAGGAGAFIFAFLADRLRPGYKEFWKAMGYAVFFIGGSYLLHSHRDAVVLFGFWLLLLLSRWRGLKKLWCEETRGYRVLLAGGLILLSWILFSIFWMQAGIL